MKKLFWLLFTSASLFTFQACAEAEASTKELSILFVEVWQEADSAWVVFEWWPGAPRPGSLPTAYYRTKAINALTDSTLDEGETPVEITLDSLAIHYPPVGDTILVRVGILPVDIEGREARDDNGELGWVMSAAFPFSRGIVYPSPVDSVIVLDTIPDIIALHVRPQFSFVKSGQAVNYCAILVYEDGASKYAAYGIAPPDPLVHLTDLQMSYCQGVLERWREEVSG